LINQTVSNTGEGAPIEILTENGGFNEDPGRSFLAAQTLKSRGATALIGACYSQVKQPLFLDDVVRLLLCSVPECEQKRDGDAERERPHFIHSERERETETETETETERDRETDG
jgi:hypothetical protein